MLRFVKCPKCSTEYVAGEPLCRECGTPLPVSLDEDADRRQSGDHSNGEDGENLSSNSDIRPLTSLAREDKKVSIRDLERVHMPGRLKVLFAGLMALPLLLLIIFGADFYAMKVEEEKGYVIASLERQLSRFLKTDYENRIEIYRQLVDLEPENNNYREMLHYLQEKRKERLSKERGSPETTGFHRRYAKNFGDVEIEVQRARNGFNCQYEKEKRAADKSIESFTCPYAEGQNVVWSVFGNSEGKTNAITLIWSGLRKNIVIENGWIQLHPDVDRAVRIFANQYAENNFISIVDAYKDKNAKQIVSANFVLQYSYMEDERGQFERKLLVAPRYPDAPVYNKLEQQKLDAKEIAPTGN